MAITVGAGFRLRSPQQNFERDSYATLEEMKNVITKIMAGETAEINNEPITMTYDELMNTELITPSHNALADSKTLNNIIIE